MASGRVPLDDPRCPIPERPCPGHVGDEALLANADTFHDLQPHFTVTFEQLTAKKEFMHL